MTVMRLIFTDLLLQIEQSAVHLKFAVAKRFGEIFQKIGGEDCVFVEHVAGKIAAEPVQMDCSRHAHVLKENRQDAFVLAKLLELSHVNGPEHDVGRTSG